MPFYLAEKDLLSEVAGLESVLIVPCRFCPAASLAVRTDRPYIELFRRFLKTGSYERFLKAMQRRFEDSGIKTTVFRSRLLHQFVLCMWSARRRRKLRERAKQHQAAVVVGCEAAAQTVRDALGSTDCRVIQGMTTEGVMSILPRFRPPCTISLELQSVTPTCFVAPDKIATVRRGTRRPEVE